MRIPKKKLLALASEIVHDFDSWSERVTLPRGFDVRAKLVPDYDSNLEDSGDWFGNVYHSRDGSRPAECDGAARKVDTRGGPIWWQPPKDVVSDAKALASLEQRVRDYYHEQWSYVGVVVEVREPACKCCGERKEHTGSLWAIESDAGSYFAEVLNDLITEAVHAVTA